ncbi:ISL3 family transposase [Salegentibacter flavus]|uniref:Transposase n=1 Tax=Salegentibacter flavus TaxID=287099 RepID=A0A1I5BD82_9FLAO|nr:ISL3 family transposase [Salegentibacter flavus]SFN72636.1 Transposase [Salegentibacter flavus]
MLPPNLKIKQIAIYQTDTNIVLTMIPKQRISSCSLCTKNSNSIHSHYVRTLADLPISGKLVQLQLRSRKFFCRNKRCPRKVFTERFTTGIRPYARRLCRSADVLRRIGLEVGGNKGAVISRIVGSPVSSSTMLRLVKQLEIIEPLTTSGIVGVDDWAFKKGRNYGTIIVDLEQRKVIDLLPNREAGTLSQWLSRHPEIHTVSRDRASAYSRGIKDGTANAIEVADRFHLLVNLREAFQKTLYKHNSVLKEAFVEYSRGELVSEKVPEVLFKPDTPNSQRQIKFEKAKELSLQGYGIKAIAKMLHAHHRTIKKYLQLEELPRKKSPLNGKSLTNFFQFKAYLQEFCQVQDYLTLYANIRAQGFNGKYTQFCHNMNRFIKPDNPRLPKLPPIETWSTSRLSFMVLQQKDKLNSKDQSFLDFLYRKAPGIKATAQLTSGFKNLFLDKIEGTLQDWLIKASEPTSELRNFAKGIQKDFDAVNQAVVSPISNGQVEGHVNKLKNIKRMMYGRADFHLLRKMVLASSA